MSASSPSLSRAGLAGEIRTTLVLAAPLVAGHVSTGLIGFVDNTLAGHHCTTTLASVTI
ncbi:MATE family efflux transporter, partial [Lysobacter sp. 2RAB21]